MQSPAENISRNERTADPDSDTEVIPDLEWQVAEETGGGARVIVHNDDHTSMEFVIQVLRNIFELSLGDAERVMLTAHFTGLALVGVYPLEEAKYKVGQAHALARAEGYPLTFTIEPEESS